VRYVQVGHSLREEFAATLAADPWDVALLQEAPPRWLRPLCQCARASGAAALTARNAGAPTRAWLSERRPDLLGSWEGGSNHVLVRAPWRIVATRRVTLTRRPERRRLLWARLARADGAELAVGCLHASIAGRGPERDLERAAAAASALSPTGPLILGGDLNLRPGLSSEVFAAVRERYRLHGGTGPAAIDHLLARDLDELERARELRPGWREIERADGLRVRLSDHAPVFASFGVR
jgi:endonuclease/exonuclease/phosphatase family metal-dependent hydrolase